MEHVSDDPFGGGSPSEESGWTTYLRDFSKDFDDEGGGKSGAYYYCSSSYCSSLISDAASHARRLSPNVNDMMKLPKKVNLVKKTTRRTEEINYEDPLEDTASSPVNSPKIVDRIKRMDTAHINPKSEGKDGGGTLEKSGLGLHVDGSGSGRSSNECKKKEEHSSDLKKRGLCLVPLSSLFMG